MEAMFLFRRQYSTQMIECQPGALPAAWIPLWRRAVLGRGMAKLDSDFLIYKAHSVLSGNRFDTAAIQAMVVLGL
jgi:hypothetical protein